MTGPADRESIVVAKASAVRVRIPFRQPFRSAAGVFQQRDAWIVRLRDRDGYEGFGEASLAPADSARATDRLASAIGNAMDRIGSDGELAEWLAPPPALEDAASDGGEEPTGSTGDRAARAVRAAIEGAALDLGLVDLGVEAAAVVTLNATIGTEDHDASRAAAQVAVDHGYRCLKLKGGSERSTADLMRRIAAIREAVGPDVALRLDVNGAWDEATALERLAALAGLRLAYVEQPLPPGDPARLASLRHASGVRIAADESVASLTAARRLIAADAVDVLVVKPARVGGPGPATAIVRDALAADVGVTVSTLLETGIGLAAAARVAAALPDRGYAHGLATGDLLASDLLTSPLAVERGRLAVPEPGLRLDEGAVARWAVDHAGAPW
ncbi:MAG: o-succinylbenzoate synthase [Chloroflexota bacterium]|jgi:o-succinylbenzoate synthase|nr:o-succinylbenzoate synthase [Chloroflexota bacterium]MDH5243401.1 o-succinylbenzoate synthase [Chloroflexota bacterium]